MPQSQNDLSSFHPFFSLALLVGVGMAMGGPLGGSLPGGQPSAPNINPPSQIDPSSIERAYAALGLTYQGNQASNQNQQTSVPAQPGMRTLNNIGESFHKLKPLITCMSTNVI